MLCASTKIGTNFYWFPCSIHSFAGGNVRLGPSFECNSLIAVVINVLNLLYIECMKCIINTYKISLKLNYGTNNFFLESNFYFFNLMILHSQFISYVKAFLNKKPNIFRTLCRGYEILFITWFRFWSFNLGKNPGFSSSTWSFSWVNCLNFIFQCNLKFSFHIDQLY